MVSKKKGLEYYKGLPYHRIVRLAPDPEDGRQYFTVTYSELQNVQGVAVDRLKAIKLANELFDDYILASIEWGDDIPEPQTSRGATVGRKRLVVKHDVSTTGPSPKSVTVTVTLPRKQVNKVESVASTRKVTFA